MNRLTQLFKEKSTDLLSIYLSSGYPTTAQTLEIAQMLDKTSVDFIELGMPFSDPLADGPTIQYTSEKALKNGMNFEHYFQLAKDIRDSTSLPMVFMGYYNQMLKIGPETFCRRCHESGIDAVIIPDLPAEEYERDYLALFAKYDMTISFLVTPTTPLDRAIQLAKQSSAFLYAVSDNSITGSAIEKNNDLENYLTTISKIDSNSPKIVGFGIRDKKSYQTACSHLDGAIIGTAFLKTLSSESPIEDANNFINNIK